VKILEVSDAPTPSGSRVRIANVEEGNGTLHVVLVNELT
jgi:hypothetical protein